MAEVVLKGLSKTFPGGAVGLADVDLTVADGEFVVLVGPSGCGKSTLLRMVAGLDEPSAGTVSIGGRDVTDLVPKSRDVAMVFQNYALYPHMTVDENLGFSLRLRHLPKEQRRDEVDEVARVLALDPLLDRKPKALSGGQRQRVAMGRAMVRHPQVFLMDEPLSNLDAKLRVAMRGELTRLHHQYKTTTLYVTHDQVEAMTLGDRIAVLNAGRLQQVGTPDELYRQPCNVFVAGFIGSPSMNLARGDIRPGDGDDLLLALGDHVWPVPATQVARRPGLRNLVGHKVIVGLRPQAIVAGTDAPGVALEVVASAVESLGAEKNVLFTPPFEVPEGADAAATDPDYPVVWTATADADTALTAGAPVTLRLDLAHAYFFDADTGLAIDAV